MIGRPINAFGEMPKQIDALRFYFNDSKTSDGIKITNIVKEIEKKYRERGILIGTETFRLKIKRLVKTCKGHIAKRKICRNSMAEKNDKKNSDKTLKMFLLLRVC